MSRPNALGTTPLYLRNLETQGVLPHHATRGWKTSLGAVALCQSAQHAVHCLATADDSWHLKTSS